MQNPLVPAFISKSVKSGEYYFLNLAPDKASSLTVVCGGRENCGPDYKVNRKNFQYHSIEYVYSGRGTLTLAGKKYRLTAGTVFRYGPGIPHEFAVEPGAHLDKFFIDFVGTRCHELFRDKPWDSLEPLHVPDLLRFHDYFNQLQVYGERRPPHGDEIAIRLLEMIVFVAADEAVSATEKESLAWQTYQNVREHIDSHCLELRSLGDISQRCGYTEAYLCRVFARFDKDSPYQYLMKRKMFKAALLLNQTPQLVKDVASGIGIEDPYLFSKTFKRVYGVSPAEFRARQRN